MASAGCGGGGDGDKTFEGDGYSFTYPGDWSEREVVGGASPGEFFTRGFAPEEGVNGLIFAIADIDTPVTVSNIDTYAEDLARPSRNPRRDRPD